jgi:hypothetical protein
MPFERLNGVIKGFVRNRSCPNGSIAKGFLTYECISFCQNYLCTKEDDTDDPVGLPKRTHSVGLPDMVTARVFAPCMSV